VPMAAVIRRRLMLTQFPNRSLASVTVACRNDGNRGPDGGCKDHEARNRHTDSKSAIANGELRVPCGAKCLDPRRSKFPLQRRLCARVNVTAVASGSWCRCMRHSLKIRSSVTPYCCIAAIGRLHLVYFSPKYAPRRVRALIDCFSADERISAPKPAALALFSAEAFQKPAYRDPGTGEI
jgi:hypothetical protein